jgi:hypothetical protein
LFTTESLALFVMAACLVTIHRLPMPASSLTPSCVPLQHLAFAALWLVKEVSVTAREAVEVDCLQGSQFACYTGSHID